MTHFLNVHHNDQHKNIIVSGTKALNTLILKKLSGVIIFGSGVPPLPFDDTPQHFYGVQTRMANWPIRRTWVIEPTFWSCVVDRYQLRLEKETGISMKLVW